jgi:hypothetical protein
MKVANRNEEEKSAASSLQNTVGDRPPKLQPISRSGSIDMIHDSRLHRSKRFRESENQLALVGKIVLCKESL